MNRYLSFVGEFKESDSTWWEHIRGRAETLRLEWEKNDPTDTSEEWAQRLKRARRCAVVEYLNESTCQEIDHTSKDSLTVRVYQDGEWIVVLSVCETTRLEWVEFARVKKETYCWGPAVAPGCAVVPNSLKA